MLDIEAVPVEDVRFARLVREQEVEVMARYGADDAGPGLGRDGLCLLAEEDGEPVGCVGVSPLDGTTGEVKRLYLAARGRGASRVLLAAAEQAAAAAGYTALRLKAGTAQPEALALYRGSGWREIPCYGYFRDDPATVCFEKDLRRDDHDPTAHPDPDRISPR